ncbi:transcription repressor OFP14-like [Gastrolobium bilobum]|uniref:transcription repressor OFP14-like n=1 Tax=Gastrolobium bilobum TaxID=150636 RepID=UPI002AAF7729|nr:transcription repressor OFP14-like [Gastrolobium bilobum]
MPKNIQKSLQNYLSKIKSPSSPIQLPSKKWILSGCTHPRTPSFALDDNKNGPHDVSNDNDNNNNVNNNKNDEATLADIDRFLFENFKSLYLEDNEETDHNTKRVSQEEHDQTSHDETTPPDLRGSNRFFLTRGFSDEGSSSNSNLNDSSSSNFHAEEGVKQRIPNNCVVVLASSPSPYEDFRRSMEGMVEARLRNNERVDWDFMEELLFCYINMNEKKSYKFILSAFVDLITVMRRRSEKSPAKNAPAKVRPPRSVRTVRIGREVRKKTKEVTLRFGSP